MDIVTWGFNKHSLSLCPSLFLYLYLSISPSLSLSLSLALSLFIPLSLSLSLYISLYLSLMNIYPTRAGNASQDPSITINLYGNSYIYARVCMCLHNPTIVLSLFHFIYFIILPYVVVAMFTKTIRRHKPL